MDLGRECTITDITLLPIADCTSTFVGITHGLTLESISTLLMASELTASRPVLRKSLKPVKCRYLSLQISSTDRLPEVPSSQIFSTPPGNIGYVQTGVGPDGNVMFTPVQPGAAALAEQPNAAMDLFGGEEEFIEVWTDSCSPVQTTHLLIQPPSPADVSASSLMAMSAAPAGADPGPAAKPLAVDTSLFASLIKHQQGKAESLLHESWTAYAKTPPKSRSTTRARPPDVTLGFGLALYGLVDVGSLEQRQSDTSELAQLAAAAAQTVSEYRINLSQQQQILASLIARHSPQSTDLERITAQYNVCQWLQAELFVARWQHYHSLMAMPSKNSRDRALDVLDEIRVASQTERAQTIASSLLHYINTICSPTALAASPLARYGTVTSLFNFLCVGQDDTLSALMLELFSKHCRFTSNAWARFLFSSIQQHFGPSAAPGVYQANVFESLLKIAKVCCHAPWLPALISRCSTKLCRPLPIATRSSSLCLSCCLRRRCPAGMRSSGCWRCCMAYCLAPWPRQAWSHAATSLLLA